MRVIAYLRVSTERQASEGVSLDSQRAKVRAWCELHDAELAEVFADEGLSGAKSDRPGLEQAMAALRKGDCLLAYSISRLSRSVRDMLAIADRLQALGCDLVSLSESIDTTTAAGRMVFRMLAVLAEFELDQIRERTSAAMRYKQSRGEYIGGQVPFGHRLVEGELEEHAEEQTAIASAREMRLSGASLRAISARLADSGHVSRSGRPFAPTQVARMLGG